MSDCKPLTYADLVEAVRILEAAYEPPDVLCPDFLAPLMVDPR